MECKLALPAVKTNCYRKSFACTGAKFWNALPDELKRQRSFGAIRNRLVDSLNLSIEFWAVLFGRGWHVELTDS